MVEKKIDMKIQTIITLDSNDMDEAFFDDMRSNLAELTET